MAEFQYDFTVFTATYNRAHTLGRVYHSLRAQTFRSFEWLVVDDGSIDGTQQLVEGWQREADFPIRYFRQANMGKHVAFNQGVREARGELFLFLDSDDACVPQALARFKHHWDAIPADQRDGFSAVTCLCVDQHNAPVGRRFPHDITDSNSLEVRYRFKVTGEKWGFHRTDVLRQYPFPDVVTSGCIPEGVVWSRIARAYRTRFINEALRIYYTDQPSLVRGIVAGQNAAGARMYYAMVLNEDLEYLRYGPLQFFRSAALYARACFHLRLPMREQAAELTSAVGRALWACAVPVGFGLYCWETLTSPRHPGAERGR